VQLQTFEIDHRGALLESVVLPRVTWVWLGLWGMCMAKVKGSFTSIKPAHLSIKPAHLSIKGSSTHNLLLLTNAVFSTNVLKISICLSHSSKQIDYRLLPQSVYRCIYAVCSVFTLRPIQIVWYIPTGFPC